MTEKQKNESSYHYLAEKLHDNPESIEIQKAIFNGETNFPDMTFGELENYSLYDKNDKLKVFKSKVYNSKNLPKNYQEYTLKELYDFLSTPPTPKRR